MSGQLSAEPGEIRRAAERLAVAEAQRERMLRHCPKCQDTRDMMRYGIPRRRWLACLACQRVIPLTGRTA